MYEFDAQNKICGVYHVVDSKLLQFAHVKDIPLEQCPAIFGFSGQDAPEVLNWAQDALEEKR